MANYFLIDVMSETEINELLEGNRVIYDKYSNYPNELFMILIVNNKHDDYFLDRIHLNGLFEDPDNKEIKLTFLLKAVQMRNVSATQALLKRKANPYITDSLGLNVLEYALIGTGTDTDSHWCECILYLLEQHMRDFKTLKVQKWILKEAERYINSSRYIHSLIILLKYNNK